MSTISGSLQDAFENLNTHEVGVMVQIARPIQRKNKKTAQPGRLIFDTETGELLQPDHALYECGYGFHFDRIAFDTDIKRAVKAQKIKDDENAKLYDMLEIMGPGADFDPQALRDMLEDPVPKFLKFEFGEAADPEFIIKHQIPFKKTREALLDVWNAVRDIPSALTEIRIAHAPRFDNKEAAVRELITP